NSKEKHTEKKSIQKILISVGSIIILLLAVISFIFLPAMTTLGQQSIPPLGKYKGKPIEYTQDSYFTRMYASYTEQERKNGREINSSNTYEIMNNAFKSTVLNMAFADKVLESKYVAPDNLIDRTLITYFQDEEGVFSPRRFRDYPNSQKVMLRKSIAEHALYQRYYIDFMGSNTSGFSTKQEGFGGLKRTSKEAAFITTLSAHEKAFDLVSFSKNDYPESEAVNFGKDNATLFTEYDFSIISFESETTAKSVAKQLQNTEILFEDAVSEFSTKYHSDESGKLNDMFEFQIKALVKEEKDFTALLSLKENELSSVMALSNGYGVFKMNKQATPTDFTKQATIDAIISYIKENAAGLIEDYFVARAKDFIDETHKSSFDQAANIFDLEKSTTTTFIPNYNNNPMLPQIPTSTPILSGSATNESFLKALFSLSQNEVSAPLVLGENIIIAKMIEEKYAEETPVDEDNFTYAYYPFTFDQTALENHFMNSSDLENNLFSVYLSHFIQF
ncbi:MAG: hypothetical protein ACRC5H_10850, partial [Treponemataceae bacterium]